MRVPIHLTAHFGITHGVAVALMLPAVVQFNGETAGMCYRGLGSDVDELVEKIVFLKECANLPSRLCDLGVARDSLPMLAKDAAEQWTGIFNPRPVDEDDFLALYESVY